MITVNFVANNADLIARNLELRGMLSGGTVKVSFSVSGIEEGVLSDFGFVKNEDYFEISPSNLADLCKASLSALGDLEALRAEQNANDKALQKAIFTKNSDDLEKARGVAGDLKKRLATLTEEANRIQEVAEYAILSLPNILCDDTPVGKSEADNVEVKKFGTIPTFTFKVQDHDDIGSGMGLLDFKRAAKLSGSRFVYLRNDLAKLERVLGNYMIEHNVSHGFEEVSPPLLTREKAFFGTGQMPKFEGNFFTVSDGYYLIPTAEVSLANMFAGDMLEKNTYLTALTPCFRSEAGAAGRDTKGIIRQHQFYKAELVSFVHPDDSAAEIDRMCGIAEQLLQDFELPYRILSLCSGDIGISSAKTYDIEVWLPSQERYVEISSVSNTLSYQSVRMKTRMKTESKKVYPHILNGSSLPLSRTIACIIENFQTEDGRIRLPSKIAQLMGKEFIG